MYDKILRDLEYKAQSFYFCSEVSGVGEAVPSAALFCFPVRCVWAVSASSNGTVQRHWGPSALRRSAPLDACASGREVVLLEAVVHDLSEVNQCKLRTGLGVLCSDGNQTRSYS